MAYMKPKKKIETTEIFAVASIPELEEAIIAEVLEIVAEEPTFEAQATTSVQGLSAGQQQKRNMLYSTGYEVAQSVIESRYNSTRYETKFK